MVKKRGEQKEVRMSEKSEKGGEMTRF